MKRLWLALAKFAAARAGDHIVRAYREPSDAEMRAYADSYGEEMKDWAESTFVACAETWPEWTKTSHNSGSVTTTAVSRWTAP